MHLICLSLFGLIFSSSLRVSILMRLQAVRVEASMSSLCPAVQMSVPCRRRHFSLRTNTQRMSMKFVESNHYHQHMNWLQFGRRTREHAIRQKIRIYAKPVLPPREWLYTFHNTYGTLRLQGWRVHYTHSLVKASYDLVLYVVCSLFIVIVNRRYMQSTKNSKM